MSRYCVDTNVLLGFTFLQNRWREHSERLLNSENSVYVTDKVLFEYCMKRDDLDQENSSMSWSSSDGKFGDEKRRLQQDIRQCVLEVDLLKDDELTPERIASELIDEHDVETQVQKKLEAYFEEKLGSSPTRREAKNVLRDLRDQIVDKANKRKDRLSEEITHYPVGPNPFPNIAERVANRISDGFQDQHPDADVIADAHKLKEQSIASNLVTGDKGDIYSNRGEINAITNLSILYLKDEFATAAY